VIIETIVNEYNIDKNRFKVQLSAPFYLLKFGYN